MSNPVQTDRPIGERAASTKLPRSKRRFNFIERTLKDLTRDIEYALIAEDLAKADGLLQSFDPRVKVIGGLALILAIALSHQIKIILIVFLFALVLAVLSRVPILLLAKRVWLSVLVFTGSLALPALFLTPGTIVYQLPWLNWAISEQGLRSALFLIARVETITTISMLVVLCTLWTRLLKALAVLGVPVVFIVILGTTYRYIFLLLQIALDMFESRQSRLIGRLDGAEKRRLAAASVGVLLSKTLQLSGEVYLAMQSRGFRGEVHLLDDFHMQPRDWLTLMFVLGLAVALGWFGR